MNFFRKLMADKPQYCKACQLQGQGSRENQQDAWLMLNTRDERAREKGILALVADGMGGLEGGDEASGLVVESMAASFRAMDMHGNPALQLKAAVLEANERVYERFMLRGGSTLAVCLAHGDELYFASVGDSSIYLLRARQLSRLNRAQNAEELALLKLIRSGSTDPEEADMGDNARALSHFIGMPRLDDIDLSLQPMKLMPGDRLLICSDGVDGSLSQSQLLDCLSLDSPEKICRALEKEIKAAENPWQDNYTALVLGFEGV